MFALDAARAFTVLDSNAPYGFHICLAGAWGFETQPRLSEVLGRTPAVSQAVSLDCRRITIIDAGTMTTMSVFADACATRGVSVTFECDSDPVGRLIEICGLDRLVVAHRPLVPRAANTRFR